MPLVDPPPMPDGLPDDRTARFRYLRDLLQEEHSDAMPNRADFERMADRAGLGIISSPEAWFIDFMVDVSPSTLAVGLRHEHLDTASYVLIQTREPHYGMVSGPEWRWTLWLPDNDPS